MENSDNRKIVGVDVYVWLLRQLENLPIAIEGVYRHLPELIKTFTPVAYIPSKGYRPPDFAFNKLEAYLGKKIEVYSSVAEVENKVSVWLSTGIDFCPPDVWNKAKIKKACILHDAFSANGYYGDESKERFIFGAKHAEFIFPISATAKEQYYRACKNLALKLPVQEFFAYTAPHSYDYSPYNQHHYRSSFSYVGSLYKRKNVLEAVKLANLFNRPLCVAGRYGDENLETLARLIFSHKILYYGMLSDRGMSDLYWRTKYFVNLSKDEGFSMTPMEAIVHGVPHIILSDIPAHRENYSMQGVYFVKDEEDYARLDLSKLKSVQYDDADKLFNSHRPHYVARIISTTLKAYHELKNESYSRTA